MAGGAGRPAHGVLLGGGVLAIVAVTLRTSWVGRGFAAPPATGPCTLQGAHWGAATAWEAPAPGPLRQPRTAAGPAALAAGVAASVAVAVLASVSRSSSSRTACQAYKTYERKWWSVEETQDPTTLPLWQRDYMYGFQVLKRSMVRARNAGEKIFWDVRVIKTFKTGCKVEMLKLGLIGWCPASQEGLVRLPVGEVVKMECMACPQQRVTKEKKFSPWPEEPRVHRAEPQFSHWLWLEQQHAIEKAKELKAGTIVDGTVYKHIRKGIVVQLAGSDAPKGLLAMIDISRKHSSKKYVEKMFPEGTTIKCYVVHADANNGRITLSTKEFEDDDHVGWMLSFPERMFARAEEGVRRYHEKRDAYIAMLQR